MAWLVMWIMLLLVSAGGVIVSAHSVAMRRSVDGEMRDLTAATRLAQSPPAMRSELPAPIERYLAAAGANGAPIIATRLEHAGRMRTAPDASWMAVRGAEQIVADPPGFVWWGRMRLAPGLWVDARDKLASGTARMRVVAEATFPLADVAGPQLDEGAAMRVLGEMVLIPTSFRDTRYVRWEPVDDHRARATLRLGAREVSALFELDAEDMPARVSGQRYRDVRGTGVLTPWHGTFSDYRMVEGVRVPFRLESTWDLDTGPFACIDFTLEAIDFERGRSLPSLASR